jgi:RNA-directed DNA polymerase
MPMEPRGTQESIRRQRSFHGRRAEQGKTGTQGQEFKLEMQSNSWLRVGMKAKDSSVVFNNLLCHFNKENFRRAFKDAKAGKARGVDGVTKEEYGKNLEQNLDQLIERLHRGTYRPQPKRRAYIPKANGEQRPIAISSFEDKLVEALVTRALSCLYEPHFIQSSYGFRESKSAHGAIECCYQSLKNHKRPYVVEIDLKSFFDSIPHRGIIKTLQKRISDRRFLSLIARFLTAGILETKESISQNPDKGAPQGSIMSPVLANIYLHQVLDEWFLNETRDSGAVIVRYADDAVFFFELKHEADMFFEKLQRRLKSRGLELNKEKSSILRFGKSDNTVFHFLGFTFMWGRTEKKNSRRTLKVKTAVKTLHKKIGEFTSWIKKQRSRSKLNELWKLTAAKLRGHYQYYGYACNRAKLSHFYTSVQWNLYRWLNRRSQRRSMTWKQFQARLLRQPLPQPPDTRALRQIDPWSVYA